VDLGNGGRRRLRALQCGREEKEKRSGRVDAGCSCEASGGFYRGSEGVERQMVELAQPLIAAISHGGRRLALWPLGLTFWLSGG
jgi:hypothetical protein